MDVDRQPRARWIIGGFNHDILELVFVHHERFARESRFDHGVAAREPVPFQRNQNNGVPQLPIAGSESEYERVDPGVQRRAAVGHAHVQARRQPQGQHLVDGPDILGPGNTVRRLVNITDAQIGQLLEDHLRFGPDPRLTTGLIVPGSREATPVRSAQQALHPTRVHHVHQARRAVDRVPSHSLAHDTAPTRVLKMTRSARGTPAAATMSWCTPSSIAGS